VHADADTDARAAAERSQAAVPTVAGPQAAPAVTPSPPPAEAPPVLDDDQRAVLRAVLNGIIPARADLPGAGDLDVGASIERTLAAALPLRRLIVDGLADIQIAAARRTGRPFTELDSAARTAILAGAEQDFPTFFVALVEHTYRGYYTLPAVANAIGLEPRPPQPLGHRLPAFDPALLARQRDRAPFWRRADGPLPR